MQLASRFVWWRCRHMPLPFTQAPKAGCGETFALLDSSSHLPQLAQPTAACGSWSLTTFRGTEVNHSWPKEICSTGPLCLRAQFGEHFPILGGKNHMCVHKENLRQITLGVRWRGHGPVPLTHEMIIHLGKWLAASLYDFQYPHPTKSEHQGED